jgi:DNA-binding NarL/FixJ family response regulator
MRIVIAEDAALTRSGIAQMLRSGGFEVVCEATDLPTLLAAVEEHRPDVVVTDIRMPPAHADEGLAAAREIGTRYPGVAVLILSQYLEPDYAARLIADYPEGVGYLLKERVFDAAILTDAVRRIADGECVVDPTIVARLLGRRRRSDPLRELTAREREVLALIAEGLSNTAIASRLAVTERTVEAHATQVFLKLGLEPSPVSHRRVLATLLYLREH